MSQTPARSGRPLSAPWSSALEPTALGAALALDEAHSGRLVLGDFVSQEDSLEWQLGQEYLRRRGGRAFVADAERVPFVVNNDGNQSVRAAEVFFASLVAAEQIAPLPQDIFVLELGIRVGQFARYFLDWFEVLCRREGKADPYHRDQEQTNPPTVGLAEITFHSLPFPIVANQSHVRLEASNLGRPSSQQVRSGLASGIGEHSKEVPLAKYKPRRFSFQGKALLGYLD
jgi:hypothetical protein